MVRPLAVWERLELAAFLSSHHEVVTRRDALAMGLTARQLGRLTGTGRWSVIHRGVYFTGPGRPGPAARLAGACEATSPGGTASHWSAAWMWQLVRDAPPRPEITVPITGSARLAGVTVHRRSDLDATRTLVREGIPVTDPLRTLADLGEGAGRAVVAAAVERALAEHLVTVAGLEAEIDRLVRPGRRGVASLRSALSVGGFLAPQPSVLEGRTARLLRSWGIEPVGVEVVVCGGRYRLDFLLRPGLALEVDGYAYHWSPEAKAADSRRRNALRLAGVTVLEADWVTVVRSPETLRRTVLAAVGASRARGPHAARLEADPGGATGRPQAKTQPEGCATGRKRGRLSACEHS